MPRPWPRRSPPTTRKPAAAQPTAPGPEEWEEVGGLLEDHGKLLTTDIQTDPGLCARAPRARRCESSKCCVFGYSVALCLTKLRRLYFSSYRSHPCRVSGV